MCDVLFHKEQVAKKEHQCIWCYELIAPGEKYVRMKGVFDGDFQSSAWHPECDEDAQKTLLPCESFTPGEAQRPKATV